MAESQFLPQKQRPGREALVLDRAAAGAVEPAGLPAPGAPTLSRAPRLPVGHGTSTLLPRNTVGSRAESPSNTIVLS